MFLYLCWSKVWDGRYLKAKITLLPTHIIWHKVKIRLKRDPEGSLFLRLGFTPSPTSGLRECADSARPGIRTALRPSAPAFGGTRVSGLPFDKRFRIRAGHAAQDDGGGAEGLLLTTASASASSSSPDASRKILVPGRRPRHTTSGGHDHR